MRITSDFSTFESFDGEKFSFSSTRKRDGDLFEELRGYANREDDGRIAFYAAPEGLEIELPEGTMLPMQHTIALLDAARKGKPFFNASMFDGTDIEGAVNVNSFISKNAKDFLPGHIHDISTRGLDNTLLKKPPYQLQAAFFAESSDSATPEYEMTMHLHENGIITDMFIAYTDFSIIQKLIALEAVETDLACDS